jgi:hypothetical protein
VKEEKMKKKNDKEELLRNEGFAEKNELIIRTCLDERLLSVNSNKVFDVTVWLIASIQTRHNLNFLKIENFFFWYFFFGCKQNQNFLLRLFITFFFWSRDFLLLKHKYYKYRE